MVTATDWPDRGQFATERHRHVNSSRSQLGPQDGQRQTNEALTDTTSFRPDISSLGTCVPIHPQER